MRKKRRTFILLGSLALFFSYIALRLYWNDKQPASFQDIGVTIGAKDERIGLTLWHNYYDGKEYLFLPSFWEQGDPADIEVKGKRRLSWDQEALGRGKKTVYLATGEHRLCAGESTFTVVVLASSKLPALFIETASGSLSYIEKEKGNGERGLYQMIEPDGTLRAGGQLKKLRSRGNSTFLEDKKPYQMTLAETADLLGSGARGKYILLANRQDQSLLRNKILYDMAGEIGLPYSPASGFVDLYINHEYRGCYLLSEKPAERLEAEALTQKTPEGGTDFLAALEYDDETRLEEAVRYFVTKGGQHVVIEYPGALTDTQAADIESSFQALEDEIQSGLSDTETVDEESFARKYLMEEIGKNLDAMFASQYFYRDNGRFYAGPVWDYDKTLGNPLIEQTRPVNYQEPRGLYAATEQKGASWWYDLYWIPSFQELVKTEYQKNALPAIEEMLNGRIDAYRDEIWDCAYLDYMRWDPFEDFKYGEELDFEEEYQAEIDGIKEFLRQREEFLSDIWLEGRGYGQIECDPGAGMMYVTKIDAVEGRTLHEPRDPKLEGFRFSHWIRGDTGERYDFTEAYDGTAFTLRAVYVRKEEDGE